MSILRGASPFDHLGPVVRKILIANVVVFLLQVIFPGVLEPVLGLRPAAVWQQFWVWQLFTYAFLHGGFWHLFINMFVLWMFGSHIEGHMGSRGFLRYYLACVLGAALAQMVMTPGAGGLVVGASGGVYGLLIAFGLLFPDSVIYLFFILPLRAIQAVVFIGLITFASAVGAGGGSRVAHFAHLGGMLTGFVLLRLPTWRNRVRLWRAERVFRHPRGAKSRRPSPEQDNLASEVDRILDKISENGVESLTPEEHEVMRRYGTRNV